MGGSTTDVGFMFDTKGRGLTCVLYNARGGEAEKLGAKLTSELGKPKKDENDGPMRDMIWAAPDKVELVIIKQPLSAAVTHCSPHDR